MIETSRIAFEQEIRDAQDKVSAIAEYRLLHEQSLQTVYARLEIARDKELALHKLSRAATVDRENIDKELIGYRSMLADMLLCEAAAKDQEMSATKKLEGLRHTTKNVRAYAAETTAAETTAAETIAAETIAAETTAAATTTAETTAPPLAATATAAETTAEETTEAETTAAETIAAETIAAETTAAATTTAETTAPPQAATATAAETTAAETTEAETTAAETIAAETIAAETTAAATTTAETTAPPLAATATAAETTAAETTEAETTAAETAVKTTEAETTTAKAAKSGYRDGYGVLRPGPHEDVQEKLKESSPHLHDRIVAADAKRTARAARQLEAARQQCIFETARQPEGKGNG
jgi:hypothetical protein